MEQPTAGASLPRFYIGVAGVALPDLPGKPIVYAAEIREGYEPKAHIQDCRLGGGDQWEAGLLGILAGLQSVSGVSSLIGRSIVLVCPTGAMADTINQGLPRYKAASWLKKDGSLPANVGTLQQIDAVMQALAEAGSRVRARAFQEAELGWRRELHDRARGAGRQASTPGNAADD